MSGCRVGRFFANSLVLFPVVTAVATGAEVLVKQIPMGLLPPIAKDFIYPAVGGGSAAALDYLASKAFTEPNGLSAFLFALAAGEVAGACVEIFVGPQVGGIPPLAVAALKSLAAAGSAAAIQGLAKFNSCCGNAADIENQDVNTRLVQN